MSIGVVTSNPSSLSRTFGDVVRDARSTAGWTQEELAHRANVHRTYIGDLENGRKSPTLDVVEALSQAFGRPVHELIADAEQRIQDGFRERSR